MYKKVISMALALSMTLCLCACGSPGGSSAPSGGGTTTPSGGGTTAPSTGGTSAAQPPADEFKGLTSKASISLAANPIGQSSYQQAAAIADLINNSGSLLEVTAEATNGYAENIGLIANGEVEIAFANNLILGDGYNATGDYEGVPKEKCLGVMSIASNKTHVIVPANSDITEVSKEQFKGKKIGIGQVGGTSRIDALNLMAALGLEPGDYTGYEVKGAEQTEMMKNNQLDVFIWNGKAPIATVVDLVTTKDVRFLDIPTEITDKMIAASNGAYTHQTLEADAYEKLDRDVVTVGNSTMLCANADVPEEVVYEFVKNFVEGLEKLSAENKSFAEIVPERMLEGISVPLHPGALRYFQEINLPGIEKFAQ